MMKTMNTLTATYNSAAEFADALTKEVDALISADTKRNTFLSRLYGTLMSRYYEDAVIGYRDERLKGYDLLIERYTRYNAENHVVRADYPNRTTYKRACKQAIESQRQLLIDLKRNKKRFIEDWDKQVKQFQQSRNTMYRFLEGKYDGRLEATDDDEVREELADALHEMTIDMFKKKLYPAE
jgi:hypothetical protein